MIRAFVPGRTESKTNQRVHWSRRHKEAKRQRHDAHWAMIQECKVHWDLDDGPLAITLTRVSPNHQRLDDDNLRGALKSIRDGIADWLGVDDKDPRITWEYDQGGGDEYGVDILVKPREHRILAGLSPSEGGC